MRIVSVICLAVLATSLGRVAWAEWEYREWADPFTDEKSSGAATYDVDGTSIRVAGIKCETGSLVAYVDFGEYIGDETFVPVRYRVDKSEVVEGKWFLFHGTRIVEFSDDDILKLALMLGRKLVIEASDYRTRRASFDLVGSSTAIPRVLEDCEKSARNEPPVPTAKSMPLGEIPDFAALLALLAEEGSDRSTRDEFLSPSILDAVRRQIEDKWNAPAGALDAGDFSVEVRIVLLPDGTVRNANIVDHKRMMQPGEEYFRAISESAGRAILQASPFQDLPPEKYEEWREFTFTFRPPG